MIRKGVLGFTLIEDAALVVWLALARAGKLIAGPILALGLFLEHVVAYRVKLKRFPGMRAIGQLAFNGLLEAGLWIVWLLLWPIYSFSVFGVGIPAIATIWLFVTLAIEHSVTDNIMHGQDLFQRVLKPKVLGFTLVEVLAGSLWLVAATNGHPGLGVIALVSLQYVEHALALKAADAR